jgi:hypothetical protein
MHSRATKIHKTEQFIGCTMAGHGLDASERVIIGYFLRGFPGRGEGLGGCCADCPVFVRSV